MLNKRIVLDANILIRAALGAKVRGLLNQYLDSVQFYAPQSAYEEALRHLPPLLVKRGLDGQDAIVALTTLRTLVQPVDSVSYEAYRFEAFNRIARRDAMDWPVLACALALDCPVWTEDQDFFGTGVPVWTSDRVHLYLQETS